MFWKPNYLNSEHSAWIGHIPFAFWIIEALTPSTFVELGTHYGDSYFAFCQAVDRLGLSTACFAVDTWKGDEHAGFYGDEVFAAVNTHNANNYSGISTLVRSTFDEALPHFEDGTIDLLHIDGHHTFEAVRHDFETWLPKLSKRAVVLFHDTNVRFGSFGVNKYFAKLKADYPWFEFNHSHGLGVLGVGSEQPENVKHLFHTADSANATGALHQVFSRLGQACIDLGEAQIVRKRVLDLEAQIGAKNQEIAECLANTNQERGNLSERIAQLEAERANLENQLTALQTERDGRVAGLEGAVSERDGRIAGLEGAVSERDARIAGLEGAVTERDGRIAVLEGAVSERDGRIAELEGAVNELQSERDSLASERSTLLSDNTSLATSNSLLATERDELSARLSALDAEHSLLLAERDSLATERSTLDARHSTLLAERDDLATRHQQLATERDALSTDLQERFEEIALLGKRLLEVEVEGNQRVAALQARMDAIQARLTWKLGAPARLVWDKTRNTALKIYRLPTAWRILRLHRSSGLFNHEWYYRQNPDVKAATSRPFLHFAFHGVFEGRAPNPSYNESAYLRHTPSAQSGSMKPLLHYTLKGWKGKSS
jgi:septal ring factor EnvC (AmiA/AmiB activator)